MKTITVNCYKVSNKINIGAVKKFYNIAKPFTWKEYLILNGKELSTILKYDSSSKKVYIFQAGCITFIDFTEKEVHTFLEFIESIVGELKYKLTTKYHDSHDIIIENNKYLLWDGSNQLIEEDYVFHIVAIVLAKSLEIHKFQADIDELLDNSDKLVTKLYISKFRIQSKKFVSITAKLLRFEYDSVESIRVLERTINNDRSIQARNTYDQFAKYYEVSERYIIIESKIREVKNVIDTYSDFFYKKKQRRIYRWEILLLSLFPIIGILKYFE